MRSLSLFRSSVLLLLLASLGGLLLAAGCTRMREQGTGNRQQATEGTGNREQGTENAASSLNPQPSTLNQPFVGDAECARCHPQECRAHQTTNHAHTLRPMDRTALGKLAPNTGIVLPEHAVARVQP